MVVSSLFGFLTILRRSTSFGFGLTTAGLGCSICGFSMIAGGS
jgi:hypothetical protein